MVGARCNACGEIRAPDMLQCATCRSFDVELTELRGEGLVLAATSVHLSTRKPVPWSLVLVEAVEGVRLIGANLARAVADGSDLSARSAVALGSLYGGLCLGPVNTAAVHALAYPLGGEFHLAHGLSIALLLPHVVRFNVSAAPARHAALARALGADAEGDDATVAAQLPDLLDRLLVACRVPRGLGAHGIPRDALPRMADTALQVTRLLKNNPRAINHADAIQIFESAYS